MSTRMVDHANKYKEEDHCCDKKDTKCCKDEITAISKKLEELQDELGHVKKSAEAAKSKHDADIATLRAKLRNVEVNQTVYKNGRWLAASGGHIPSGAILAYSSGNVSYYVARSRVDGHLLVGKLSQSTKQCFVPCRNSELSVNDYEVLVDVNTRWQPTNSSRRIPDNAVPGGFMDSKGVVKETLYIGRADHSRGMTHPGYVYESTRELLISRDLKNEKKTSYEILVRA